MTDKIKYHKNIDELNWETGKTPGFSSKQLITLAKGGFKIVKIAPESIYPVHTHPDKTEIIFVLEGSITATINDAEFNGKSKDFFVFPAGARHSVTNTSNKYCEVLIGSIKVK